MLTALYPWIVFVHVAAAFAFVLAHGVAVFAGFRVRQDRDRARMAALLDLSTASGPVMYASLVVLLLAGLVAGFAGGWFGRLWIWTALVLLVAMAAAMAIIGTPHYRRIRILVGAALPAREARRRETAGDPESADEELAARLRSRVPEWLTAIGGGGLLIVIWLMLAKPF